MNVKLLACVLACSPLVAEAADSNSNAGILKSGVYLQNLDKSVRPQDDFYRHINGGWLATAQIPADRSNYGTFTKLQEDAERDLRDILEEAVKSKAAPGSDAQKVGDYYASFLDEATVEARGLKPKPHVKTSLAPGSPHATSSATIPSTMQWCYTPRWAVRPISCCTSPPSHTRRGGDVRRSTTGWP